MTGTDFYTQQIALYEQRRVDHLRQAAELGDLIQRLIAIRDGSKPDPTLRPVEPGEFRGFDMSPALRSYLKARKGHRIHIDRVVRDLLIGGVEPGKPRDKNPTPEKTLCHNLKITANVKSKRFPKFVEFDPASGEMWAADTIDDLPKPRASRPKSKPTKAARSRDGSAPDGQISDQGEKNAVL